MGGGPKQGRDGTPATVGVSLLTFGGRVGHWLLRAQTGTRAAEGSAASPRLPPQVTALGLLLVGRQRMSFRKICSATATVAAIALTVVAAASADSGPVVVFNHGNTPDNVFCDVIGAGGEDYLGFETRVVDSDGIQLLTCHAKLVSGTPVSKTIVFTQTSQNCTVVFTPAGVANVTCPNFVP